MSSKRKAKPGLKKSSVHWKRGLALLVIPILVAIAYGNAMRAPFVYDDRIHILENPLVTSFDRVFDFSAMTSAFDHPSGLVGRPLLFITYGMNYAVSGADPQPFRRVNLWIHTANSFLVFWIVMELAHSLATDVQRRFWLALLAAALFAVHPLATESVSYIAGRSSSLCATFYLGGLWALLRAGSETPRRRWVLLILTSVLAAIGLLVKQDANVLLPACVVLIWLAWPLAVTNNVRWASTAFLVLVTLITIAAQFRGLVDVSRNTQSNDALVAAGFETTLPLVPYVLTSVSGLSGYYFWRLFIPVRLNIDPEVQTIATLSSPALLVSLAVLIGLSLLLLWLWRRKPLMAVGIGLVMVSPLSAYCIFPLADVIAEHRAYITVLGAVIILADIVLMLPRAALIALALVSAFVGITIARNEVWSDAVLLWSDASRQAPWKLRPHVNLGALYQARGQADRAIQEYQLVLGRDNGHSGALANLASIYLERNDLKNAEELLNHAIALKSAYPAVYLNLGVVRLRQRRLEEARQLLEKAITLNPNQLMAHLNLGDVLINLGQPLQAIQEYLTEIQLNRDSEMTHLHLAAAF